MECLQEMKWASRNEETLAGHHSTECCNPRERGPSAFSVSEAGGAPGVFFRSRRASAGGFTFVEMLVAAAVGALVLAAVVLAFQTIGNFNSRQSSGYQTITFPSATVISNFYGVSTNVISTWTAPSAGYLARAEILREKFIEDTQKAVAVYCLPRVGQSSVRPQSLSATESGYAVGSFDFRRLGTSEEFRQYLASVLPSSAGTFATNAFAGNGASAGRNLSIMVLTKSASRTNLYVRSIYEVDFIRPASPAGVYASVRRYQGTVCTDYYDVFYPDADNGTQVNSTNFYVAASFERSVRPVSSSSVTNIAAAQPFYFVWWPDAAATTLPGPGVGYTNTMADQTSFFMVVPMFPAL